MKCGKGSASRLKATAIVKYNICGCGERSPAVKAPGCGPGDRGFKSHRSPQFTFVPIAQRTRASVFGLQVSCPERSSYVQDRIIVSTTKTSFCS